MAVFSKSRLIQHPASSITEQYKADMPWHAARWPMIARTKPDRASANIGVSLI
jgi:hypothetical protein